MLKRSTVTIAFCIAEIIISAVDAKSEWKFFINFFALSAFYVKI
jgi:hypothetical protein